MVKATALLHKELIPGTKPLGVKFSAMGVLALVGFGLAIGLGYWGYTKLSTLVRTHLPVRAGGEQEEDFMAKLMG